jgi:hypothetical protein
VLTRDELREAMLLKLADSGLDAQDATRLKFTVCTQAEAAKFIPWPAGGFVLPYFTSQGKPTDFYRYRYLETVQNGNRKKKPYRYTQPSGKRPQLYFSPLLPGSWKKYFARPEPEERSLLFTEGENKANCACKRGLPTIGLGGVWNWMSKREGLVLIPELEELPLEGVPVYICFDSDARNNFDIIKAENALARQLQHKKALPYIIRLPELNPPSKTGLDDFLVKEGEKAFSDLLDKALRWGPEELFKLNEEVILLRESSTVLEHSTRHRWRASEFANVVYANRHHYVVEEKIDKKTNKSYKAVVEKNTAREWIKWEHYRAEVEKATYRPGEPLIVGKEYNTWRGWGLSEDLIKKGDISLWRKLIDFIVGPQWRNWLECWLAYPLQNPGTKLFQSVVVWGRVQGTGKTLIGHTMARIYGTNFSEINERHLHSSFNSWAEYKQFVMGDEITGGDKRAAGDFLKGLITQKFLYINPKFIPEYTVPDCINYYFTSNHPDAFFLEDSDRRFAVFEVKGDPLPLEFYKEYDCWYKSDAVGALFYHLLHLDTEELGYNPAGPAPVTDAKREMIADGRSDLGSWVARLRDEPDSVLRMGDAEPIKRRMYTTSELLSFYDPGRVTRVTENGLSRELKRAGIFRPAEVIATKRGSQKLWVIRDIASLAKLRKPKDFAAAYNADWEQHPTKTKKKEKFE